jgi:hypothetical protein
MRAVLDQVEKLPLVDRAEDRSISIAMWAGLIEHRPDRVETAAALTARNYFDDSIVLLHPKSWSLALAHRLAGKDNTARADPRRRQCLAGAGRPVRTLGGHGQHPA